MIMGNNSKLAKEFMEKGRLISCPVIDAHTHMGPDSGADMPLSSAEDMIKVMDRENIEMIFCSPHSALHDPGSANSEIEAVMAKYPDRVKGLYCFNPNYEEKFLGNLEDVLNVPGYIGIKLLPTYHRYPLDGENYVKAMEFANKHKLYVLIHTWGNNDPHNAPRHIKMLAEKYPDTTLVMGHSAPGELDKSIEVVKTHDNVYLDICDIHRHSGIIDKMVSEVGADKVLFGTDMPWYDPNYAIGSVLFSQISDEDKYKILYGNAKRLITKTGE